MYIYIVRSYTCTCRMYTKMKYWGNLELLYITRCSKGKQVCFQLSSIYKRDILRKWDGWQTKHFYIVVINFIRYRILRTIGRYFFSSTRWLRHIVHIDLYKDDVKKILIKMTILFTVPLFCCRFFFLNKIEIVDVLGVVFVLNKAIKVYY